jgi:hypothetical protein
MDKESDTVNTKSRVTPYSSPILWAASMVNGQGSESYWLYRFGFQIHASREFSLISSESLARVAESGRDRRHRLLDCRSNRVCLSRTPDPSLRVSLGVEEAVSPRR